MSPLLQTSGDMDPTILTLGVMTERGGPLGFLTALASAMETSVVTTVASVAMG